MAVATSSRRKNFEKKSGHLQDLFGLFEGKIVCGDDKQYNMKGKPAPDIFLTTARVFLGRDVGDLESVPTSVQLEERRKGLVFEDAIPGMQAGKRAGMSGMLVTFMFILFSTYQYSCSRLGSRPESPQIWISSRRESRSSSWIPRRV